MGDRSEEQQRRRRRSRRRPWTHWMAPRKWYDMQACMHGERDIASLLWRVRHAQTRFRRSLSTALERATYAWCQSSPRQHWNIYSNFLQLQKSVVVMGCSKTTNSNTDHASIIFSFFAHSIYQKYDTYIMSWKVVSYIVLQLSMFCIIFCLLEFFLWTKLHLILDAFSFKLKNDN